MKTIIVSGSHRAQSQSLKVSKWIQERIAQEGGRGEIIDLSSGMLPLWDESFWDQDPKWNKSWAPIAQKVEAATSLVVVSPEYGGMVPAALKNFFLFLSGDLVAHKPALIVSVTSSFTNGAYPVMELRGSSYKNSKLVYIPDHVIVRSVEQILNIQPLKENDSNFKMEQQTIHRLNHSLKALQAYDSALTTLRSDARINLKEFPNGM